MQVGGADGDRTRDLLNAIQARSQLRHSPTQAVILAQPNRVSQGNERCWANWRTKKIGHPKWPIRGGRGMNEEGLPGEFR